MTKEERIRYLKGLLKCELCEEESTKICKSCDNRRIGSSAKCYDALKEVIKELEQEPILDKIRAEINEHIEYNKKMNYMGIVSGLLLAKNVLDKYKAESEPKDGEKE